MDRDTDTTAKRILVVEDDTVVRTSLTRILERAGFDVVAVAEYGRARDLVEAELFHALITDLDLPDGTGLDLLESVRHLRPGMRSILITGDGCSAIRKQAFELEHVAYFEKPFDPRELLAALD